MTWEIVINNNYMGRPHHCGQNNLFNMMMTFNLFQYFMNSLFNPVQTQPQIQRPCCMPVQASIFSTPILQPQQQFIQPELINPYAYNQNLGCATYQNLIESKEFQELLKSEPLESFYPNLDFSNYKYDYADNSSQKDKNKSQKVKGKKVVDGKNQYVKIARQKAKKYGVDERLVLAMINQESGFINGRTSNKGAQGLMQLVPATAKDLGVTDINDPEQNIDAGVRYIKQLLNRYNGDVKKALAAYNWGMGNLEKQGMQKAPKETKNYVSTIYGSYKNYDIS